MDYQCFMTSKESSERRLVELRALLATEALSALERQLAGELVSYFTLMIGLATFMEKATKAAETDGLADLHELFKDLNQPSAN